MRLYLVRHGETVENKAGIIMGHQHGSLSEDGQEQVQGLAEQLKGVRFDGLYSSDLGRCKETVEILKSQLSLPKVNFNKALRESSFGSHEGLHRNQVLVRDAPDREPFPVTEARVINFINKLLKQHRNHTLLVVTHGGPIKAILKNLRGLTDQEAFALDIANASVTVIELTNPLYLI